MELMLKSTVPTTITMSVVSWLGCAGRDHTHALTSLHSQTASEANTSRELWSTERDGWIHVIFADVGSISKR